MIPKIIHYCWFGGKPLPKSALKCIASWKKFFPNYEIKEWNESNCDLNCCDYVREAYAAKKWAFVSDYVRFDVLYKYGGLYFDVDVEVVKGFDDIIEKGTFMGCEGVTVMVGEAPIFHLDVNPGLGLGATPGHELYREVLDDYHSSHFINNEDNLYNVVQRVTGILRVKGFDQLLYDKVQNVCNVDIYPPEYFSPKDYRTGELIITRNTRTIHHYAASWVPTPKRLPWKINGFFVNAFGKRIGYPIAQIVNLPIRFYFKVRREGMGEALRAVYRKLSGS